MAQKGQGLGSEIVGGLKLQDSASIPPLNLTERSSVPSSPETGDLYLDDGTNTGSSSPGWRRYTGAAWEDVGALASAGTVTSVAAGDGLDFTTITGSGSITLGTPSDIDANSSNNVSGTGHTHALDVGFGGDQIVIMDSAPGSIDDGDFVRYNGTGLESRTVSEVKTDLSLNNVENTAISSWAGSANITTLGTIATGTWSATDIGVEHGGTGLSATTAYSVLCGGTTTTGALQSVATVGSSGQVLTSNGASTLPTWQTISSNPNVVSVNQTAHGLSVGDVIKSNGTDGEFSKAQANSAENAEVVGIVISVDDVNNFSYSLPGFIDTAAAVPNEVAESVLYLDPTTAGALTAIEPTSTGHITKPLGIVTKANSEMVFVNMRGNTIGGASGTVAMSIENLLHVREEQPSATQGGTFTAGAWQTRTLNTVKTNNIDGSSLSSNQITLPAGDYIVDASAPAYKVNGHQLILYDTTNTANLAIGTGGETSNTSGNVQTRSLLFGEFTISSPSVIELRHRCQTTNATNGLGDNAAFGINEVYSELKIWRYQSATGSFEQTLGDLPIGDTRTPFLSDEAAYYSASSRWLNLTSNTSYDKTVNTEYESWFEAWGVVGNSFTTETFDDRFARLSDSRAVGNTQEDAFQGHKHTGTYNPTGPLSTASGGSYTSGYYDNTQIGSPITDGVNGTPRTADETRPKNIAAKIYVKIA